MLPCILRAFVAAEPCHRVADADRARLDSILNQSAVNLQDRREAGLKAGWSTFDASSRTICRFFP
jgi:hypothetical protein